MPIDYAGFAFPKPGTSAVRLSEAACRAAVWARWGRTCAVLDCGRRAVQQHHVVKRSQSRALQHDPSNRWPVCLEHHRRLHAGETFAIRVPSGTWP